IRDPKLNVPNDAFLGFRTAGQAHHDAAVAAASKHSPGKELRDRKHAALLTTDQEVELRQRWQFSGDERIRPAPFDPAALPFERGNTGSALRIPMHSTRHLDALTMLKTYEAMDESKEEAYEKWHAKMSSAFDPKLITLWRPPPDEESSTPRKRRVHTRVQRTPPRADNPSSTPPLPTPPAYLPTQPEQAYIPTQAPPPPLLRPRVVSVASTSTSNSTKSKLAAFMRPPSSQSPPNLPPAKRRREYI
ncbi:hypothetical protein P7C70_g8925, partial [Phenoliferia sp. Uapishka_3]